MNMKRQISVSIFLAILVLVLAWLYIKFSNETNPRENMITTENDVSSEQAVTISQENISYPYCIREQDGKLVVFKNQENEIYMETSIEIEMLPFDIQQKLKKGIYFQTESALYDFLESYSS